MMAGPDTSNTWEFLSFAEVAVNGIQMEYKKSTDQASQQH
jgi:hypothetical protein